jgi:tetratricopeptide (TPR) repeat protein
MIESLDKEIRILRAQYWSARDPEGRGFAPLAEAYRLQGEFDEAASLVQDGLERLPGFLAGYLVASRIARDRGDLLGARDLLDQALELDAENVVARFERATLALEEGDREGALSDLRIVLDLDPLHQDAARRLDEIESGSELEEVLQTESGALPETEVIEPAAIETAPTMAPAYLIDLPAPPRLKDGGDSSEPQDDGPDPALFTRTMGDLYAAQGFLDRAREVYQHLSAKDPDDADLRGRLEELGSREGLDEGDGDEKPGAPVRAKGGRIPSGSIGDLDPAESERSGFGVGERTARSYFTDILAWIPGAVPIASLAPDDSPSVGAPVPIALLAPDGALGISHYGELGPPVPVEFLAPDAEGSDSSPRDPLEANR